QAGLRQVGRDAAPGDAGAGELRVDDLEKAPGQAGQGSTRRRHRRQSARRLRKTSGQLFQGDSGEKETVDALRAPAALVRCAPAAGGDWRRRLARVPPSALAADARATWGAG